MSGVTSNREVENAAMIFAMMNGASMEEAKSEAEAIANLDDDLSDIEGIEEVLGYKPKTSKSKEKTKVKTTRTKTRQTKKTEEEIQAEKELADRIDECTFAELKKATKLQVEFKAHSIPYKEQEWPIPRRDVIYDMNLVSSKNKARAIVRSIYNGEKVQKMYQMAEDGMVRYYEIVIPFTTAVPNDVRSLGYVEVGSNKKFRVFLINKKILEKNFINYDTVMSDVGKTIKEIVKYR